MNVEPLHKRIDKIVAEREAYHQHQPHDDLATALFPAFVLFTGPEQTQIEQQLAAMASRVSFRKDGQCDLRQITNDELDQLWAWQQLYDALLSGDQAAITQHRESLARG